MNAKEASIRKSVICLVLGFSCLALLFPACRQNRTEGNVNAGDGKSSGQAVSTSPSSQQVQELKNYKPEGLLKEIRTRELNTAIDVSDIVLERQEEATTHQPSLDALRLDPSLAKFSSPVLTQALLDQQKAIYGEDNRKDVFLIASDQRLAASANAVVSLFDEARIIPLEDGKNSKIVRKVYGTEFNLCDTEPNKEPFISQPCSAYCSGVLVAPDIIATAGHCLYTPEKGGLALKDILFVFGYRMRDASTPELIINNEEIYRGQQIIKQVYSSNGLDYALIRLARAVKGHSPVAIRRSSKISDHEDIYVIGHPCGLPAKFADGAVVRNNLNPVFFAANLDTYGGNSGSPVFNRNTHVLEGILVRGEKDFVSLDPSQPNSCFVSLRCPTTGCQGEDCTRTTVFASLVPPQ